LTLAQKIGAWITSGVVGGLIIVGTTIKNIQTDTELTPAQMDSIEAYVDSANAVNDSIIALPGIEMLIWAEKDNLNPDSGGYRKGDCVHIIRKPRTREQMIQPINKKFKIVKVYNATIADLEAFCNDDETGLRRQHKISVDSSKNTILEMKFIKAK